MKGPLSIPPQPSRWDLFACPCNFCTICYTGRMLSLKSWYYCFWSDIFVFCELLLLICSNISQSKRCAAAPLGPKPLKTTSGLEEWPRGTPGRTEEPGAREIPWPHDPQTALIGLLDLGSSSTRGRLYALRVGLPLGTLHLGGVEGWMAGYDLDLSIRLRGFTGAAQHRKPKPEPRRRR